MTSTDAQVRLIMRERSQGRSQEQAAVKANLKSRKTAAKYERAGKLPGELKRVQLLSFTMPVQSLKESIGWKRRRFSAFQR